MKIRGKPKPKSHTQPLDIDKELDGELPSLHLPVRSGVPLADIRHPVTTSRNTKADVIEGRMTNFLVYFFGRAHPRRGLHRLGLTRSGGRGMGKPSHTAHRSNDESHDLLPTEDRPRPLYRSSQNISSP